MLNFKKKITKNVCLIGLMGSGKTAIGRDLSHILKLNFIDTDFEIEREVGISINNIFKKHGESFFRQVEEKICLKALKNVNCIISLGGGSVLNKNVRSSIKHNSFSIFLKTDINIILKRLRNSDKRPLLKGENKKKVLEDLYNERIEYYSNCDLTINNTLDRKNIVRKIQLELKKND